MQVNEDTLVRLEQEIFKAVNKQKSAQQLLKRYLRLQRELFRADHKQMVKN